MAVIRWPGSRFHNQIIYFNSDEPRGEGKEEKKVVNFFGERKDPLSVVGSDFFRAGRGGHGVKNEDMELVQRVLDDHFGGEHGEEPDYSALEDRPDVQAFIQKKVEEAKKEIKSRRKDFDLEKDGFVEPLMDNTAREAIFIVGCAGAGKSVFASKKMKSYRHWNATKPIYLLSKVQKDEAFDGIPGVQRITIDEKFVKDVKEGKIELADCCIVFDDVDTIADEKTRQAVQKLRADLLETGR